MPERRVSTVTVRAGAAPTLPHPPCFGLRACALTRRLAAAAAEPEFFFPRSSWMGKRYTARLTITQAVADASHGGVLYYFCHAHSKMSGRIVIRGPDGGDFVGHLNRCTDHLPQPTRGKSTCTDYLTVQVTRVVQVALHYFTNLVIMDVRVRTVMTPTY